MKMTLMDLKNYIKTIEKEFTPLNDTSVVFTFAGRNYNVKFNYKTDDDIHDQELSITPVIEDIIYFGSIKVNYKYGDTCNVVNYTINGESIEFIKEVIIPAIEGLFKKNNLIDKFNINSIDIIGTDIIAAYQIAKLLYFYGYVINIKLTNAAFLADEEEED